jgi:hypothetical protein
MVIMPVASLIVLPKTVNGAKIRSRLMHIAVTEPAVQTVPSTFKSHQDAFWICPSLHICDGICIVTKEPEEG